MSMRIVPIDWRTERAAFSPFLAEKSGVVQFKFSHDDCAPNQFSTLLKQIFNEYQGNGPRFSIRIDTEFATTHTPIDVVEEFKSQLKRLGIVSKQDAGFLSSMLSENDVGGNMDVDIGILNNNYGKISRQALSDEVVALQSALDKFVDANGRFMIEFRDCRHDQQHAFWHEIWGPLLSNYLNRGMIFVHMLGPKCNQTAHEDAPSPQWVRTLPAEFASSEQRQEDAYDDLMDVFTNEGQSDDAASAMASTHLSQNLNSVSGLHTRLSSVLLNFRTKLKVGN